MITRDRDGDVEIVQIDRHERRNALDIEHCEALRDALYAMLAAITRTPVPVLASVNGAAIGAGTQLAIACDLRVAAPTARFAIPTARNGLAVDPWTVRRLALLAGGGAARALLIGCDSLDAGTAFTRGLVDRLGDHAAALAWAHEIAGLAPLALAYSKRALNDLFEPAVDAPGLRKLFDACWASARSS
jgi:enoyl-CoA hydratase